MKKHNLHTHTRYSDGQNTPEELIRKSAESGLEVIGITDHGFTIKTVSLNEKTLPEYIQHLQRLKRESKNIHVLAGLEIDVSHEYGKNPEDLPFVLLNQLDYVLFEYVNGVDKNGKLDWRCLESVVDARKKLRIPAGLAHTNLRGAFYKKEKEAIRILGENDIFVELNLAYVPDLKYWSSKEMIESLKEHKVKFTIGTDVHLKDDVHEDINPAMDYILQNGLEVHEMVS